MSGTPLAPGVSVVIPVLDDADRLRGCLRALGRQDRRPDEVIVVDNGSTDHLEAVVREACERQGLPIRLLHEPRTGVSFAAHTGYDAAAHEVIARCDADSVPGPGWLSRHLRTLESTPRVDGRRLVAVSGAGRFAPGPWLLGRAGCALYLTVYRVTCRLALAHAPLWGSNMVLRTSWWREVGSSLRPRAGIHDDFDLSFQLRPHEAILVDRRSVMPVSWRAAVSVRRLVAQQLMARRLLRERWRQEPPWERHRRWISHAVRALPPGRSR